MKFSSLTWIVAAVASTLSNDVSAFSVVAPQTAVGRRKPAAIAGSGCLPRCVVGRACSHLAYGRPVPDSWRGHAHTMGGAPPARARPAPCCRARPCAMQLCQRQGGAACTHAAPWASVGVLPLGWGRARCERHLTGCRDAAPAAPGVV